ncbi:MAG: ThaI family type II restriction endonuclease [archaeon]|nr:ThaI family type II restriction endonuclease [archaeon]
MGEEIATLFKNSQYIKLIQEKLPILFQIANIENSRDGKIGMEVGSAREVVLIALLMKKYGRKNVIIDSPINSPEADVKLCGMPISIKTIAGRGGVKLIWTVDAIKARKFLDNYKPSCDILLAQMFWEDEKGGLFLISKKVQEKVFANLGKEKYLKLPKQGTNPRGVEISAEALDKLLSNQGTLKISVKWKEKFIEKDNYERWLQLWSE